MKYYLLYTTLNKFPPQKSMTYKANLINFLLNDPNLINLDTKKPTTIFKNGDEKFSKRTRYWWLILILKDIVKNEEIDNLELLNYNVLPEWLNEMVESYKNPITLQKQETEDKKVPVITLLEILSGIDKYCPLKNNKDLDIRMNYFSEILKAGQKWTKLEIRSAWYFFSKAYVATDPNKFWTWVEQIRSTDPSNVQNFMIDEFDILPSRTFATHLLSSMIRKDTFTVKSINYDRWPITTGKQKIVSENGEIKTEPKDIFWNELLKSKMIRKDFNNINTINKYDVDTLQDEIMENLLMGEHIDNDDIGLFNGGALTIVDYNHNEVPINNNTSDDINLDEQINELIEPIEDNYDITNIEEDR